jgi:hypothetical protein
LDAAVGQSFGYYARRSMIFGGQQLSRPDGQTAENAWKSRGRDWRIGSCPSGYCPPCTIGNTTFIMLTALFAEWPQSKSSIESEVLTRFEHPRWSVVCRAPDTASRGSFTPVSRNHRIDRRSRVLVQRSQGVNDDGLHFKLAGFGGVERGRNDIALCVLGRKLGFNSRSQ